MKKETPPGEEKIVEVWVQPRASANEILGYREGYLRIRVTAAPAEGAANRLCREVLAKALGVSTSRVEILSGHKARRKRISIKGADEALWENLEIPREGSR
jgi:uncharacterized protein (TIGR00251 family)